MITNKNINLLENIPAIEELFGSQHKNKNMQMRHTRNVKTTSHCCNDHHIKRGNSYFNMK